MVNAQVLLVGLFCQILISYSPVTAQGPSFCRFPFIYKDVSYSRCITKDDPDGNLWCSTKTDHRNKHVKGNYKSCTSERSPIPEVPSIDSSLSPSHCQFPFIYKDVSYSRCITQDDPDGKLWCSTKTDVWNKHVKGNYISCTSERPNIPKITSTASSVIPSIESSSSLSYCRFPFIYKDVSYSRCITLDDPDGKLWCSTKTDHRNNHIKGNYRSCTSERPNIPKVTSTAASVFPSMESSLRLSFCVFPFIYKGVTYSECTRAGGGLDEEPWCSTKTDSQNNHINKNWRQCTGCRTYHENASGDCVSIRECRELNKIQQQVIGGTSSNGLDILTKSTCGYEGPSLRVCCSRSRKPECGNAFNANRITNGHNANLGAWPWMVVFLTREKNCHSTSNDCKFGLPFWSCGGVLINDRYVLTAAHCFDNRDIQYVRIGEYNLKTNPDVSQDHTAPRPQDIDVEKVIAHPSHKSPCSKCNDIALVKLKRPAQLHPNYVQPICLPSAPELDMGYSVSEFQNKIGIATGWGVTEPGDIHSIQTASILQQANMTIQGGPFCRDQKRKFQDGRSILCAGQGDGQDTCRGDSGGPLMLADDSGLQWYVVGIASFGNTICGARDSQAIFTSVHHYIDWIKQNIS